MNELLNARILGMPAWLVGGVVIGGGLALAWYIRRGRGSGSGALGQNSAASAAPADPNIDPNTGVPYSVEEATNPATGLPAYYGTPGLDGSGQQPPTPPAPGPGPGPTPGTGINPPPGPGPVNPGPFVHPIGPEPGPTRIPSGPIPTAPAPAPAAGPRVAVVSARTWPNADSSLFSIWQNHAHGIPFNEWQSQVLRLNPQISNPNRIYPNEAIRVPA